MLLLSTPQAIGDGMLLQGQLSRRRRTEKNFADKISLAIAEGKRLSAGITNSLPAFPGACFEHGRLMMKRADLAELLITEPYLALVAIYGCPALARELEQTVYRNSETMFEYEIWRRAEGLPRYSSDDEFRAVMERDAFWAYRLFYTLKDEAGIEQLFAFCESARTTSAGAALLWLVLNEGEDGEKYVELLQGSPQHAYLAKKMTPIQTQAIDEAKITNLTPRWGCHFALLRPTAVRPEVLKQLLLCPGWTIEFLTRAKLLRQTAIVGEYLVRAQTVSESETRPVRSSPRGYYNLMSAEWIVNYKEYLNRGAMDEYLTSGTLLPASVEKPQA